MKQLVNYLPEQERLIALQQTGLLDSSDEAVFDDQIKLLAGVFDRPIAALSLVDRDRLFLKSRTGLEQRELDRDGSFCAKVVRTCEVVVVPDAMEDDEFCRSGLVQHAGIRFYAGMPIQVFPGCCIGSLCVLGSEPGEPTELMLETLATLAAQVGHLIALRRELLLKGRIQTNSVMAAGALHEIKNQLTPAVAYLDLLVEGCDSSASEEVRREWLMNAFGSVNEAVGMLQSLRFDRGAPLPSKEEQVPILGDVIDRVLGQVSSLSAKAEVSVVRPCRDGDQASIDCRIEELRQVVSNLVLNAIDALPQGGELRVSTRLDADGVYLEVADNGEGMTAGELGQCFDPLFSTKHVKTDMLGGGGIGLTIVKQIVCDLGGSVGAQSEVGQGTTMTVRLPSSVVPTTLRRKSSDKLRVMVVDDQRAVLKSAEDVLESMGHRAVLYENPEVALQDFREAPEDVDLAIIDVGMGPINGLQLVKKLHDLREDLPVIIASGERLVGSDLPSGTCHLEKPFRLKELRATVKSLITSTVEVEEIPFPSGRVPRGARAKQSSGKGSWREMPPQDKSWRT
jgi:signal transduction histidine kinase